MQQLRQQQGFTMIELIMVIVILGVLSAFALPRFADLGTSARGAAIDGIAGAMRSAVGIARAQALAAGETNCANPPVATADTICLDGLTVTLDSGFPVADDVAGIIRASGLTEGTFTSDAFTDGDYTYTRVAGVSGTSDGTLTIAFTGVANCSVVYTDTADGTGQPTVVATSTCQ